MYLGPLEARAEHAAALYHSVDFLVERVASFIAEGLASDERVLVVCTLAHWNRIAGRLEEGGVAYGRATSDDRLVFVDADEVVDTITDSGLVRVDRFNAALQRLLTPTRKTRIYGEVVSLLAQRGDFEPAMAIERLGEELAHAHGISILCGYHLDGGRPLGAAEVAAVRGVHGRTSVEPDDVQAPPRRAAAPGEEAYAHAVRFYRDRESLARIVGQFLGDGFIAGSPAVVIATEAQREAIARALSAQFFEVGRLQRDGALTMVDAASTLSHVMEDGLPDPQRFHDTLAPLLESARAGRPDCVVRAYGEMADVLWRAGRIVAAVRLETLWNQLPRNQAFAVRCSYSMGDFYRHCVDGE